MPCNSSDGQGSPEAVASSAYDEVRKLRKKNDELTSMLCALLRGLNDTMELPPETVKWYQEHKAWDRSQGRGR